MSDPENDSVLWIRELLAGTPDVVSEFCSTYGPALERIARSRMSPALQQRLGPEDILQSVCRTFFRRGGLGEVCVDNTQELWRLLCAITLTKVRQHARFHLRQRRGMDREVPAEQARGDGTAIRRSEPAASEPSPEEIVEFAEHVELLLAGLDDDERQLVLLRMEGHDQAAIATQMQCSDRTVRRILDRIRRRWEEELQKSFD